jgi:LPS sulfotransferase NodH
MSSRGPPGGAWQDWFASVGIRPHPVRYEELDADPAGVTRDILDFLGLELPPGHEILARHRRLADGLNTQWIDRYRAGPGPGLSLAWRRAAGPAGGIAVDLVPPDSHLE